MHIGYTGGSNRGADMDAIRRAATQQEVVHAKIRLQKKRAVAKVLDIKIGCKSMSYKQGTGTFRQQWDKFLPPTSKYGWTGHKPSSGFSDLAPSILHYNWF
jgi:hypothetical protein